MKNDSRNDKTKEIADKIKESATFIGPDGKKYVSQQKMEEEIKKVEKAVRKKYGVAAAASIAILLYASIFNGVYRNANPRTQPVKPIVTAETQKPIEPFWKDWFKPSDKPSQPETELEVEIETEPKEVIEP